MPLVERPAVESDIATVAVHLNLALRAVIAALAQRLKWPAPKFIEIAVMRLDVIADGRWLDSANLGAVLAQRMLAQLVANSQPACRGVKIIPSRRLAAHTHGLASCNR
jgi:hypothetical protein